MGYWECAELFDEVIDFLRVCEENNPVKREYDTNAGKFITTFNEQIKKITSLIGRLGLQNFVNLN